MKTIVRHEIASGLAHRMVGRAVEIAGEKGWEICAAIVDPRGHAVALARTDEVVAPAIGFALDKAWTAATLATSTGAFFERATASPPLAMGLANRERVLVFPGGFPILDGTVCIGGLGVSGARDHEDIEIARAVIAEAGLAFEKPDGAA